MRRCSCCLAVLLSLIGVGATFEFISSAQDCKNRNTRCILISTCPEYKTRANARRNRPIVCGFEGGEALVCCGNVQAVNRRLVEDAVDPDEPLGRSGPVRRKSTQNPEPYETHSSHHSAALPAHGSAAAPDTPVERPNLVKVFPNRVPVSAAVPARSSPLPEMCGQPRVPALPADGAPDSGNLATRAKDRFTVRLPAVSTHILGGAGVALLAETAGGPTGHRWPWIVLLGRWTDDGLGDWFCGGTLITDRHVLTAAHCVLMELPTTVGVRIGDHDLGSDDEVDHQERNVSSIVMHPQFGRAQNDLAVLRLAAPVQSSFSVEPICLPPAGAEHVGRDAEAAGWGMLEFGGESSDLLQEVPLRVSDPVACETAYRRIAAFDSLFPGGFQKSKLCAESGDEERRDACAGDSGGPLVVRRQDGAFELVGVVSTGIGCGTEFPGLYTKVSAFIDWIVSNLT